ncbi:MAG TPA: DUF1097 domain-containing protein [Gemmatimonadales bacterium]|nr:DUF1097 domain-containing protein [Gemmatimonadales bacterium]
MSQLVALSVSIGVLGGIATILYLKVGLLIWAGFIAWACFFHAGGDANAFKTTVVCNLFGAVCAWVAALLILSPMTAALSTPVWAGIIVGLTVFVLCLGAHIKAFSSIPASVYGYASVFAFLLGNMSENMTKEKLMSGSMANALILVFVSMLIGAIFGMVSGKVGAALTKKA